MLIFTYYAMYAYAAMLIILTYVYIMLNISYAHVVLKTDCSIELVKYYL